MNQLLNNLQAALAALRGAKPNPALWSGPAATAFTHRVDLLEIEFTVLCAMVAAAALNPTFGGGPGSGVTGGIPVIPLQQLAAQLGLHF